MLIDLTLKLLRQLIQLTPCTTQRLGIISQHALRRLLHTFAKLCDSLAGFALGFPSFIRKSALKQLLRDIQRLIGLRLRRLPKRFIQLLAEQRLGGLGVVDRLLHVVRQLLKLLFLLAKLLSELLALRAATQSLVGLGLVKLRQFIRDLLLVLVQLARILAHLVHRVGELAGSALAELIAQIVQLLAGTSAGALGFGDHSLFQRIRRSSNVLAGLLKLLARL